jgi:hypothetical protein
LIKVIDNNVVKNSNSDEADLCLSSVSYDADKNILSAFFRVLPGAESGRGQAAGVRIASDGRYLSIN